MYFAQRVLLYPGAFMGGGAPARAPWGEAVTIATPDGESLYALHAPAGAGSVTVLFFHGNADFVGRYGFLAEALNAHGIGLLAASYRGYPGSTGSPAEEGLLTDGVAAYDWLAARGDGPVVPLGQSLGSGVAVHVATLRPVAGLILISAYDSVLEVARRAYPFLPVALLMKDRFRSDRLIEAVKRPKLFIHGGRDGIIPLARGRALFEIAPEPKRMEVLDGYGHNDIWSEAAVGEIVAFVRGLPEIMPPR